MGLGPAVGLVVVAHVGENVPHLGVFVEDHAEVPVHVSGPEVLSLELFQPVHFEAGVLGVLQKEESRLPQLVLLLPSEFRKTLEKGVRNPYIDLFHGDLLIFS